MRSASAFVLSIALAACGTSDDEGQADEENRARMRSAIEGTWVGSYSFADGRPATRMDLVLRYAGSGQVAPRCGNRVLSAGLAPQCVTTYQLPLESTLSTADGSYANVAASLSYVSADELHGDVGGASLSGRLQDGKLAGSLTGSAGGSFSLTRK